jgi:hypothetical protein
MMRRIAVNYPIARRAGKRGEPGRKLAAERFHIHAAVQL